MTLANRFKLLVGFLVVLVVAALATYHLNESRGRAASDSAQILAKTYEVGTPYAGLVVDQAVDVGDTVRAGQPLFTIDSATLEYDRKTYHVDTIEGTTIDAKGHLVVLASAAGRVTRIAAERGTFVPGASDLATVERASTLYVQAEYTLSAKEYARVEPHARVDVELPNHHSLTGHVVRLDVRTAGGKAEAIATVQVDGLTDGAQDGVVSSGAPVTATLTLRNEGPVTTVADAVKGYLHRTFG
jgi:multidrug resistance efflux pump